MPLLFLRSISEAVIHLRAGDLVIYSTETAYALGADATNPAAVTKVFRLKRRPATKPLPLIVASLAMATQYAAFNTVARVLAEKHWPGPLTLVLPLGRRRLPRLGASRQKTVALRVSGSLTARELSRRLGGPLVSTSANRSGSQNTYSMSAVRRYFAAYPEPIYVLNAGTLRRRQPSTIVAFARGRVHVVRQGSIRVSAGSFLAS